MVLEAAPFCVTTRFKSPAVGIRRYREIDLVETRETGRKARERDRGRLSIHRHCRLRYDARQRFLGRRRRARGYAWIAGAHTQQVNDEHFTGLGRVRAIHQREIGVFRSTWPSA